MNVVNVPPASALQHELGREALRDYFAALAMASLVPLHYQSPYSFSELVAETAYLYADAMLRERAK